MFLFLHCSGHDLGFWSSSLCLVVQLVNKHFLHTGRRRFEMSMDVEQLACHFHWWIFGETTTARTLPQT